MDWTYQGRPFNPEDAEDYFGFVYLITNIRDGRRYIGKKFFTFAKTKRPLKGRKNRRRSRVESDWKDYWGSSKSLTEDVQKFGQDSFTREILYLCESRAECAYWETYEIMIRHALKQPDLYYNSWVSMKLNGVGLHQNNFVREA